MVDPVTARVWAYRGVFAGLLFLLAALRLLPVGHGTGQLPGPDLMLALVCAWVLRRPAFVPAPLVVALFLLADLLLQRPPGLYAALVLAGTEMLRARAGGLREQPFPVEWGLVSVVLLAMAAANQLVLALLVVDSPPLGLALLRALVTAAVYPAVVAVSVWLFGVRRPSPGEVDALGDRL